MRAFFRNIIKLAFIILLLNLWSCGNKGRFKKLADKEVKDRCACLEFAKVSASPNVSRLLEQVGNPGFNVDTFCNAVRRLTSQEKEEVLQLTKTIYNQQSELGVCLLKAKAQVVLGNSEDRPWNSAVNSALMSNNGCPLVRFLYKQAFVYAGYAIGYLKIAEIGCRCFEDENLLVEQLGPNIMRLLEEASDKYRAYIYQESYSSLSKEEKIKLAKLSDQVYDETSGIGQCIDSINHMSWEMIDSLQMTIYHKIINHGSLGTSDDKYGKIKTNMIKHQPDCRFFRYQDRTIFSGTDTTISY